MEDKELTPFVSQEDEEKTSEEETSKEETETPSEE